MAQNKYYVVWQGRQTGVFTTWEECKTQVDGYAEAKYKAFPLHSQAVAAYLSKKNKQERGGKKRKSAAMVNREILPDKPEITDAWCVDAACAGNPGEMEYRCVALDTGTEIFHSRTYPEGTNNIGEFLAIVHALALLAKDNTASGIYTDSSTALSWLRQKKCKTKLTQNNRNTGLFEVIARAEDWLAKNSLPVPVVKWETELWGEIPADFGRK